MEWGLDCGLEQFKKVGTQEQKYKEREEGGVKDLHVSQTVQAFVNEAKWTLHKEVNIKNCTQLSVQICLIQSWSASLDRSGCVVSLACSTQRINVRSMVIYRITFKWYVLY